ncbi:ABC transporter substrate-binding protein [Nocardia sp. NBC_01009]|uniref:ABC transporter substrate-binding protein n=1 Tax=Nocardia sp. NBC_01009 TaxID=2975996 RepID=UPI00386B0432|nr:ABC transporter substrate-binding protein [Nocardia sp. NBC_01009]
MKSVRIPRGWALAAVVVLVGGLALGIVTYGPSSNDTEPGSGEPVTIAHARGTTTVEGSPKRVVALGNQWMDTALALGVTPVGYIDTAATVPNSTPPWEPDSLRGATALNTTGNIAAQAAALKPDLILVDGLLADQQSYDELSKIAPTLPALSNETVVPWRDQVTALGAVLRRTDRASKVIADVDKKVGTITQANPGLRGKTVASTWLASPAQLIVLTDPNTVAGQIFTQLGLGIPKNLADQPASQGRLALAPERVDELTADLLLAGYSPGMDETYRQLPGFRELPAVQKGAVAFLTIQELGGVNQPTALSVPYLLDKLQPAFANAAK